LFWNFVFFKLTSICIILENGQIFCGGALIQRSNLQIKSKLSLLRIYSWKKMKFVFKILSWNYGTGLTNFFFQSVLRFDKITFWCIHVLQIRVIQIFLKICVRRKNFYLNFVGIQTGIFVTAIHLMIYKIILITKKEM